jgi:taurine dioxygenase
MKLEKIWKKADFGIRIFDLDLTDSLKIDFTRLSGLIHQYGVVALNNQNITDDQYIEFAKELGELVPFKFKNYSAADRPEIMILNNQAQRTGLGGSKVGNMWHSDSSYLKKPLDLTLLLGKEIPHPRYGGNTLFVNTNQILNQMDSCLVADLESLEARHEVTWTYKVTKEDVNFSLKEIIDRLRKKNEYVIHPCISTHPKTGKKNLYMSPGYTTEIVGMRQDESTSLMEKIFNTALQPENIFSYEWKPADLLIWDNRSVWHMATPVEDSVDRLIHRIGIQEN